MDYLREDIFKVCFQRYDGKFAGSQRANNKFDAEPLQWHKLLRPLVADAVAALGMLYKPDMVVPMPNGANWLGLDVAYLLGTALLLLCKNEETGEISYQPGGQQQLETAKRVLYVEDVPNRRSTTIKALALPGMAERVVAEVAILDRGMPDEKLPLQIPVKAMFVEPIPAMLPKNSPYWRYAS